MHLWAGQHPAKALELPDITACCVHTELCLSHVVRLQALGRVLHGDAEWPGLLDFLRSLPALPPEASGIPATSSASQLLNPLCQLRLNC